MKCQTYFQGKIEKIFQNIVCCNFYPGPSCSKLTMLLVNDLLKFTSNDMQIC